MKNLLLVAIFIAISAQASFLPRKSVIMEQLHAEWVREILETSRSGGEGLRENLQFFQLSQPSMEEFFRDLRNFEEKFARRTIIELSGESRKLMQFRYLSAIAEKSFLQEVR